MATRTLLLRAGSPRDIDLVEALMADAFDPRFGEAWTRSQCLGVLAMPGVRLMLAFLDDEPAGFALTRIVVDEIELLLLATAPAHRRRGVAATLLRALLVEAQGEGCRQMHLEVRAGNDAAQLYTANGFRPHRRAPRLLQGPRGAAVRRAYLQPEAVDIRYSGSSSGFSPLRHPRASGDRYRRWDEQRLGSCVTTGAGSPLSRG